MASKKAARMDAEKAALMVALMGKKTGLMKAVLWVVSKAVLKEKKKVVWKAAV